MMGAVGVGNNAPAYDPSPRIAAAAAMLLANFNSFVLDWVARFSVGGTHMNFYIVKQLPALPPQAFLEKAPTGTTWAEFIAPRVLELSYTAWDLQPFAKDLGYNGPPFKWDDNRRFLLRAELDAAFFHLYGINRDDADYIMEAFPIVKRGDIENHGSYRTKEKILEIYDALQVAIDSGNPYQAALDPPPAAPAIAHRDQI